MKIYQYHKKAIIKDCCTIFLHIFVLYVFRRGKFVQYELVRVIKLRLVNLQNVRNFFAIQFANASYQLSLDIVSKDLVFYGCKRIK